MTNALQHALKNIGGLGGMASVTARIISRATGYDRNSKPPTISYRENVVPNCMKHPANIETERNNN